MAGGVGTGGLLEMVGVAADGEMEIMKAGWLAGTAADVW